MLTAEGVNLFICRWGSVTHSLHFHTPIALIQLKYNRERLNIPSHPSIIRFVMQANSFLSFKNSPSSHKRKNLLSQQDIERTIFPFKDRGWGGAFFPVKMGAGVWGVWWL